MRAIVRRGFLPIVPAVVYVEWWRGRTDIREAILAMVTVESMSDPLCRAAGEALARMNHDAISADGRDRSEKGARRIAGPRRTVRTPQVRETPYALRSKRIGSSEWSRHESSGLSSVRERPSQTPSSWRLLRSGVEESSTRAMSAISRACSGISQRFSSCRFDGWLPGVARKGCGVLLDVPARIHACVRPGVRARVRAGVRACVGRARCVAETEFD